MAGPTQRPTTPTMVDGLIRELTAKSSFPTSTIQAYAERVKQDEPHDAKFFQLVERTLSDLEEHDRNNGGSGRSKPADFASILEILQESDRQALAVLEPAKPSNSPLLQTPKDVAKALEHQVRLLKARDCLFQRYMAISVPYLPCTQPLAALQAVDLSNLELASHNRGSSTVVSTLAPLLRHETRIIGAVVDRVGNTAFLELTCIDTKFAVAVLHGEALLVIKEPFVTTGRDVAWYIRVDHPTNIVKLGCQDSCSTDPLIERRYMAFSAASSAGDV